MGVSHGLLELALDLRAFHFCLYTEGAVSKRFSQILSTLGDAGTGAYALYVP